jgi:hypothetical protein
MDFEIWVQERLDGWLCTNLTFQDACMRLAGLIKVTPLLLAPYMPRVPRIHD